MIDPMTSAEQAEAEAVERTDEARREQHWREAVEAARGLLDLSSAWGFSGLCAELKTAGSSLHNLSASLGESDAMYVEPIERVLHAFAAEYGVPALLRVLADALEVK